MYSTYNKLQINYNHSHNHSDTDSHSNQQYMYMYVYKYITLTCVAVFDEPGRKLSVQRVVARQLRPHHLQLCSAS